MVKRKKEIKRISLIFLFVTLLVISNLPAVNKFQPKSDNWVNENSLYEENTKFPQTSNDLNLTDFIIGQGVNRTVRLFMNNQSRLEEKTERYFDIPAPATGMNLSSGDLYFNFDNNFTTDYVVENDSALNPVTSYFEEYHFERDDSSATVKEGIGETGKGIDDLDGTTFWNITSSANGIVNLTINANFSDASPRYDLPFNRNNIAGFILDFEFGLNRSANVTVYMKWRNITDGVWRNVTNTVYYNYTQGPHRVSELSINENLGFINESDCVFFQFLFDRSSEVDKNFNVTFFEFDLDAFVLIELPIASDNWVALEFDLRGLNSTVNGFYAWIRTLNLTMARNAKLNISLYRANNTMARTQTNLKNNTIIQPDLTTGLIDSKIWGFTDYHGDELFYFDFDTSKTNNLSRYNYFIVIKSNRTEKNIYSLVTIPTGVYGDGLDDIEHQVKTNWSLAFSELNDRAKNERELDVSQFKLNITRGYIPSDFKVEGKRTLEIQGEYIDDINDLISGYHESPTLKWGLGRWNHDFKPSIASEFNKFQVNLTWNTTYIKGFKFNVNYTVEAFISENITSFYKVNYNRLPEWIFNYTLNLYDSIFDNWNFTQFWYLYPNYFNAYNLAIPNSTLLYNKTNREFSFDERPNYKKFVVNTSIIDPLDKANYNGTYSLNLTSPNAIYDMHSYINFKGILWETRGFMYGDNISVSVDIRDQNGLAPKNTNAYANVILFYPFNITISKSIKVPGANLNSTAGKISNDGTILTYGFNNDIILELTKEIPLDTDFSKNNHYSLRFFWTNGSIVGCRKINIYIFVYDISLNNCSLSPEGNFNGLNGRVINNNKLIDNYSLLIASINETTGYYNPNFYPVNNSLMQTDGTFSYNYEGWNLQVYMKNFLQNETILNPEEKVKIKVVIENLHPFLNLDVNISVKFVSLANENWIIAEKSSNSKNLKLNGDPNGDDTQEFEVDLTIPKFNETDLTWKGVNAPVRQGGAKTIVDVFIENNYAGTYNCNNYSLLINDTDNEFEGYILALKYSKGLTGETGGILERFEREDCVYLPNKTTFMANIYDKYYVSFFNQYIEEFELKFNSKFDNIIINPQKPLFGETFNLSAVLTTEFGSPLQNKEVLCQYYKDGKWTNISEPKYTNISGSINFEIESLSLEFEESLVMNLSWTGDNYTLHNSQAIPIDIITQVNDISIISKDDESIVYRNKNEAITFKLENKGNSILRIIDITIDIEDKDLDYKIRGENEIILNWFTPGETTEIIVEIDISDTDFSTLDIQITVIAVNILSNEILVKSHTITVDAVDETIADLFIEFFIVIMVGIIVFISVLAYFYAKKTIKKTEIIAKEPAKRKPRRGRYVKVSELETKEIEKPTIKAEKVEGEPTEIITEEKIEPKEIEEIKTTDLDTLLEEEIVKKEEKPPKKARKLPKKVKKPSKKPRKVTPKPVPAKKLEKRKKAKKEKTTVKKAKKQPKKKKKLSKKVEPKRVKKKKTTDLDDLLKEKGLDESK